MLQRRRITSAQTRPVWALLLSTALVASAAVGIGGHKILNTQGEGITPVAASVQTASFQDGTTVKVSDPAVPGQGGDGEKAVKEFSRDTEFSMFALTWQGQKEVVAHFRGQRADGTWTQWFSAEPASENQSTGKNGTDLIYLEPTKKVQVSLLGADMGSPEETTAAPAPRAEAPAAAPAPAKEIQDVEKQSQQPGPEPKAKPQSAPFPTNYGEIKPVADVVSTDLEAVFIDGKAASAEPAKGGVKLMADSDGMPRIISRAGWGADESIRKNCQPNPDYTEPTSAITIHHTAGSNNYTEQQSAGIVRGIYQYHGQTLGWCDVGYNTLVDKFGNIFEGRYGGVNKPIMGAHAGGFNENTWAISMMGDYSTESPSSATIKSVGELAGWRAHIAGFDPMGSDTHYSEGTEYTKYPQGTQVTLPNVFAHRDVGTTTCPGDAGYAKMGEIRQIAKAKYDAISAGNFSASTPTSPSSAAQQPSAGQTTTTTTSTSAESTTKKTPTEAKQPVANNEPSKVEPAPAPAQQASAPKPSDLLGLVNAVRSGDIGALASIAGTIFSFVLTLLASQGKLPSFVTVDGGVPKIAGISLASVPGKLNEAKTLSSDPKLATVAKQVMDIAGPVLGKALGPVQYAGETSFQKHEGGMVVQSPDTGAHAVWGAIGDAWAQQGFDAGPLGLPLNEEYNQGGLKRVDFEHGYITYDPATNRTDIHTN